MTPGQLQRFAGRYWDLVGAGHVYEVVYGASGPVGSINPRWPAGKGLAWLTWEPPPGFHHRPGDLVTAEPEAIPWQGPTGWTARKLKLAAMELETVGG